MFASDSPVHALKSPIMVHLWQMHSRHILKAEANGRMYRRVKTLSVHASNELVVSKWAGMQQIRCQNVPSTSFQADLFKTHLGLNYDPSSPPGSTRRSSV